MNTRHPARTDWSRRDMLRGGAAAYFGIYDVVRFDTFWLDKA